MWLPVFDLPDPIHVVQPPQPEVAEGSRAHNVAVLPGQIALFGEAVQVLGDLYLSIQAGDFRRARDLRRTLIGPEGESRDANALAFVDELGEPLFWQREPSEILLDWRRLDEHLSTRSPLRDWVRRAVVHRLIGSFGTGGLVERVPAALPLVANCLLADARSRQADEVSMEAREIIQDALVAGRLLAPGDFEDPEVSELLAEDLEPEWLACLGVLRRVLPCPRPCEAELQALRAGIESDTTEAARAHRFLSCLKVVAHVREDEALRLEARRQMKRLNAGMHAVCVRQPSLAR